MSLRDLFDLARRPSTLAAPAAPTVERGYSGGPSWGGSRAFGDETDTNAVWRPPERWATVRKMRAFPDTNAAMDAIILALVARDLEIVPASEDPEDVAIAEFIANDLHHLSDKSLFDFRVEALDGALWDGVAPYQTVYSLDRNDGMYHLRKLAYRPPATITRWPADEHGGPSGIVQLDDMGREVEFTMDELLVFTHRRRGGDLTGNPLSRRMYAPWYVLDKLYKIGPAAIERHGMGIPTMRGATGTDSENARIENILMGLRAAAMSYVRLTQDQSMADFDIKGLSGTALDPLPMMDYMRRAIFLSTFTQGQVLGSDGVGSLALSETHLSMLMVMLKAIGQMETDTLNRYLIPRWVGYNWAGIPEARMPKAVRQEVKEPEVERWFGALIQAVNAGVDLDRDEVRRRAHELLDVPISEPKKKKQKLDEGEQVEPTLLNGIQIQSALDIIQRVKDGMLTKDQAMTALLGFLALPPAVVDRLLNPADDPRARPAPSVDVPRGDAPPRLPPPDPPTDDEAEAKAAMAARELRSIIALEALGIAPDFRAMAGAYEEAEQRILKAATATQRKQIANLLQRAKEAIAKRDPMLVVSTDVRFVDELAAAIEAELVKLYDAGAGELAAELEQQDVTPPKPDADRKAADATMIAGIAAVTAGLLADRLARAWSDETLRQMRGGAYDGDALKALLGGLSDQAILDAARRDTTVAVSIGRKAAGEAAGEIIDHYIVSAILDGFTCEPCGAIDGSKVAPADVEGYAPNKECKGRDRCRCVLVPVVARGAE